MTANIGHIFIEWKNHPNATFIGAKDTENSGRRR